MRDRIDFELAKFESNGRRVTINPATGNQRLIEACNDVEAVIDVFGGVTKAATKLGVEEIEIEHWIDDHYIPTRYAEKVHKITCWSIWSIQIPPIGQFMHITPVDYSPQAN